MKSYKVNKAHIDCLEHFTSEMVLRTKNTELRPFIFLNAINSWPAIKLWTPSYFKNHFQNVAVVANFNLPPDKVPYLHKASAYTTYTTIGQFLDVMLDTGNCYIAQEDINSFPNLKKDYNFNALIPKNVNQQKITINLWIGSNTRSGLHYDSKDNFLSQIYGTKKVILIAPEDTEYLYPIPDNFTKSLVDPLMPNLKDFPKFRKAHLLEGQIHKGDTLFIPRGWWHYIYSQGPSISMNCWYGESLTYKDFFISLFRSGWLTYYAFVRDFFRYGVMMRPYEQRLFSPPPAGKMAYDLCKTLIRRFFKQ